MARARSCWSGWGGFSGEPGSDNPGLHAASGVVLREPGWGGYKKRGALQKAPPNLALPPDGRFSAVPLPSPPLEEPRVKLGVHDECLDSAKFG